MSKHSDVEEKEKYSIFPPHIIKILKADAEGRQIHKKTTAKQYRYEARERVKQALADIRWYTETQHKQCEKVFSENVVGDVIVGILKALNQGPIPDNRAYKMVLRILRVVDERLNYILDLKLVARVRLTNPDITRRRYSNIAALELMFILFFEDYFSAKERL